MPGYFQMHLNRSRTVLLLCMAAIYLVGEPVELSRSGASPNMRQKCPAAAEHHQKLLHSNSTVVETGNLTPVKVSQLYFTV